jgi:hypothetical protein
MPAGQIAEPRPVRRMAGWLSDTGVWMVSRRTGKYFWWNFDMAKTGSMMKCKGSGSEFL